jgi:hypothetical protein
LCRNWRSRAAPLGRRARRLRRRRGEGDEEESEFGQFIADGKAESPFDRAADPLTKEAPKEGEAGRSCAK